MMNTKISNKEFFDETSLFYDEMISFEQALSRRIDLLRKFVENNVSAADFGCGSGLDSIALSKLGLEVTAFDQSHLMIEKAQKNAAFYNVKTDFLNYPIDQIPHQINAKFDLIVSLGNTLANLNELQLKQTIFTIRDLSKSGGKVLIQILNYSRILSRKTFTINSFEGEKTIIKRFYNLIGEKLFFNISIKNKNSGEEKIIKTELFPHTFNIFSEYFGDAGFKDIELFGSLSKEKFEKTESNDLVITAQI